MMNMLCERCRLSVAQFCGVVTSMRDRHALVTRTCVYYSTMHAEKLSVKLTQLFLVAAAQVNMYGSVRRDRVDIAPQMLNESCAARKLCVQTMRCDVVVVMVSADNGVEMFMFRMCISSRLHWCSENIGRDKVAITLNCVRVVYFLDFRHINFQRISTLRRKVVGVFTFTMPYVHVISYRFGPVGIAKGIRCITCSVNFMWFYPSHSCNIRCGIYELVRLVQYKQLCWPASHWVSRTQMESITVRPQS